MWKSITASQKGMLSVWNASVASAGLCASRSEARRAVEQGGVTVNGEKVTDIKTTYTPDDIKNAEEFVLKRGKKKFCKIVMK